MNIYISYPDSKIFEPDDIFDEIAKSFNGKRIGSGCGFGYRDLDYYFSDEVSAKAFIKKCRESKAKTEFDVNYGDE